MPSTKQLSIRPLTPALQKKAIDELNEVSERIAQDIAALRDWIAKQPHLKARINDQFLVAFLRGSKYSLEKAKKKIDSYYTLRTLMPELFPSFVDQQRIIAMVRMGIGLFLPLPLMDDGPRIMLVRAANYPTDQYTLMDFLSLGHFANDLQLIEDDNAVISGFVQVVDCADLTAAHFMQMSPARIKRFSHYTEEALPMRMKASHAFNTGAAFEIAFATVKPILPEKIQKRVFVHGNNMESLYEHVPQKYLPKEYGGENSTIEEIVERDVENLLKYREYLLSEREYGTNEKLRVGKPIDIGSIFGLDGSFRTLDVD